tara:strand:- start:2348 stop:2854 length:507 start_codon:yes stop_codon:yes gene_type:complete
MQDTVDIIKTIQNVYENDPVFSVLKDYERVLDELGLYVYDNWEDGELVEGPIIGRHFVQCSFMYPRDKMPDPMGGKRLLDYDCKVTYKKDHLIEPRKIIEPDDVRPGTKKGKLDKLPIWLVTIIVPKQLMKNIYSGYKMNQDYSKDPATSEKVTPESDPIENTAQGEV